MKSKRCVAMLLAGGAGTRLGVLTRDMAKPAVPYGGKYRIIDFTLSNCINSDIDTVGVPTQYRPLELNNYIAGGQPWDLDRNNGGVFILPPYMTGKTGEWFKGTANAIYQNMAFIEEYNPQYVLILSGDHIYTMDYSAMIDYHEKNNADATIAVIEVPWDEASRFGIMNTNEDGSIYEFEEKPPQPKSNKASMGVYVFTWKVLRQYLIDDEANPDSKNDFGMNIIPAMLGDGKRMFAFPFRGYWKDVGTIDSLWESNMDLLEENPKLDLYDKRFRVYARNIGSPPHHIGRLGKVERSLLTEGSHVNGTVIHSVISTNAVVRRDAEVIDSVIMPGAIIDRGAKVYRAIVGVNTYVGPNAVVGSDPTGLAPDQQPPVTVIGSNCYIPAAELIEAGKMVGDDEYPKKED
ncbi:MAG: glucose-1-phosphate adenylyltransferase [Clostridia bacterium]|nr:glucose-1-phosphate adenylyltransferase [Clostridia bacterium]